MMKAHTKNEQRNARTVAYRAIKRAKKVLDGTYRKPVNSGTILFSPHFCGCCGKRSSKLDAHHIQGYANRHSENVFFLCRSCHKQVHDLARIEGLSDLDDFAQFYKSSK